MNTAQFPRHDWAGFLYACQWRNGVVKVGATRAPRRRMQELCHRTPYGRPVQAVVAAMPEQRKARRSLFAAERDLIGFAVNRLDPRAFFGG